MARKEKRVLKTYPMQLQLEVAEVCADPEVNTAILAKEYDIPVSTIYGWVKRFKEGRLKPRPRLKKAKVIPSTPESEVKQAELPLDPALQDALTQIKILEATLNDMTEHNKNLLAALDDLTKETNKERRQSQILITEQKMALDRKDIEISALRDLYLTYMQYEKDTEWLNRQKEVT